MKRIIALLLMCVMLCVLVSCSGDSAPADGDNGKTSSADTSDSAASGDGYFIWNKTDPGRIDGLTELGKKQTSLVIPEECTYLCPLNETTDTGTEENDCLTKISFKNPDTELGRAVFKNCVALIEVSLPENLTILPISTFFDCTSLQSVVLPDKVKEIGAKAFSGCESLSDVRLNRDISLIPDYAFRDCKSLISIEIPSNVAEIGISAFDGCEMLENIIFEDGLTKVYRRAFQNCNSLKSIRFPESLKAIEEDIVLYSTNIEEIYLPENADEIDDGAFNALQSFTIYVKEGSFADIHFTDTVNYAGMHTKAYY